MNSITGILTTVPFLYTPKVNAAEHFVIYVISSCIPKTLKFLEIRETTQNYQILTKVCDAIDKNQWKFYKNNIHLKPYNIL